VRYVILLSTLLASSAAVADSSSSTPARQGDCQTGISNPLGGNVEGRKRGEIGKKKK